MQANGAKGQKNDRLKEKERKGKERKGKERKLTSRVVTAIYIKERGAPT